MSLRNIATFCLAGSFSILTACTGAPIDFERMSAADLMAYNRGVEFWDQIYCAYEIRAGSHIRRRHCNTLVEIREGLSNSADAINVLGSSRIF
ncbi:MAG: hypothetical protein ACI8XU_002512 [Kiritimatiellia bacterium]|jgi:hypothetical protein